MKFINPYFCEIRETTPSYQEFYNNVICKNVVCLLDGKFTSDWTCRRDWVRDGKPNYNFLCEKYGSQICPVYNCNKAYFDSNPKEPMPLHQYIDYCKKRIKLNSSTDESNQSPDILYLKDWHFFQQTLDESIYHVLEYFESDYLNEYCLDKKITDYRFVYMGVKSSNTPLHTDVFGSFSWSSNICGLKKWLIIPKCNVNKLKQLVKPPLPNDLYSTFDHDQVFKKVEAFEIIQKPGETLFVPSGYMHQVENLEDTISINHNWFNGCNLNLICENILEANDQVQKEIADLKEIVTPGEWQNNCEKILSMHFGINLEEFVNILTHIANRLTRESNDEHIHSFRYVHDVSSILQVASRLRTDTQFYCCLDKLESIVEQMQQINLEII